MCEYCKGLVIDEETKDMFSIKIGIQFGNVTNKNVFELYGGLATRGMEINIDDGHELLYYETVPVKYCPMCGESLAKLKELSKAYFDEEEN